MIESKIINRDGNDYLVTLEIYNTNKLNNFIEQYNQINNYINNSFIVLDYLSESSNKDSNFITKAKKIIHNIVEKIKEFFKLILKNIRSFIIKIKNNIKKIMGKDVLEFDTSFTFYDIDKLQNDFRSYIDYIFDSYKNNNKNIKLPEFINFNKYTKDRYGTIKQKMQEYEIAVKSLDITYRNITNQIESYISNIEADHNININNQDNPNAFTQYSKAFIEYLNNTLKEFNNITQLISKDLNTSIDFINKFDTNLRNKREKVDTSIKYIDNPKRSPQKIEKGEDIIVEEDPEVRARKRKEALERIKKHDEEWREFLRNAAKKMQEDTHKAFENMQNRLNDSISNYDYKIS